MVAHLSANESSLRNSVVLADSIVVGGELCRHILQTGARFRAASTVFNDVSQSPQATRSSPAATVSE